MLTGATAQVAAKLFGPNTQVLREKAAEIEAVLSGLRGATDLYTEQSLGQTQAVIRRPADVSFIAARRRPGKVDADYARYAVTADGISPMALPGQAGAVE